MAADTLQQQAIYSSRHVCCRACDHVCVFLEWDDRQCRWSFCPSQTPESSNGKLPCTGPGHKRL